LPGFALTYYNKIVPISYVQDPFGILSVVKQIFATIAGIFRAVPRAPYTRAGLFEVVTKTTALACENLMLAIAAQGYASCPMEGFDEKRVKSLLGLNSKCRVVMVIGIGEADASKMILPQFRVPKNLVVKKI
jgi:nitroreductase